MSTHHPAGMLRRYRVAGIVTGCLNVARQISNGRPIYAVEWPRPSWYRSRGCACCSDLPQQPAPDRSGQLMMF